MIYDKNVLTLNFQLEVLGGYLVTICILCINIVRGLSTFLGTDPTASIGRGLMNTVISSAVCCLVTILLSAILKRFMGEWRFHWLPARMIMNSILIGAVSVSGGCTLFSQWASAVIGIFASIGYIIWTGFLSFAKVDDVTGSITVHLGGGLLGATCAPVFKRDIGLVFTENTELAAMSLLWNLVCVLSMIALTMIVVGAVMILPTMLQVIPLSAVQQLQGLDFLYLKQEAYSGFAFTPFNTDVFEDRETFSDSRQTTPLSQQAMGFHLGYPQAYDNDGMYPTDDPEAHLEGLKGLSSSSLAYTSGSSLPGIHRYLPDQRDITFHNSRDLCSPGDRHVWFGDDMLEPEFPLVPLDERVDDSRINTMRRLEYC